MTPKTDTPTTPYGILLFQSDSRAALADTAARALQRESWYRQQLSALTPTLSRLIELTRELDCTFPTPKQQDLLRDMRRIANQLAEALEDPLW